MDLNAFLRQWHDSTDYILAHTSGSTGAPKAINLLKTDMLASANATNAFFRIDKNSVLFLPLSMEYIAGMMMAVRSIAAGCTLFVVNPSNEFEFPEDVCVDLISVVPSQVDWLLSHPEWSSRIRNVIIGGASLDAKRENALISHGFNAYVSYGMTETCSHVALRVLGEEIYKAMPGVTFSMDDRGCLVVNCEHMSIGRVKTNDIVDVISPLSFVWKGRYDNVINSGGIKIYPETVEKMYSSYLSVPFFVRGIDDPKWGQRLELVVEGTGLQEFDELMETLKANIDHKFVPAKIKVVDEIPRTSNGKIKRL